MTTSFSYQESLNGKDKLTTRTLDGIELEFLFEDGECSYFYIDGDEHPTTSDTLHGLFVRFGFRGDFTGRATVRSIADVINEAQRAYPDIMREIEQDAREAVRHERSLHLAYYGDRV